MKSNKEKKNNRVNKNEKARLDEALFSYIQPQGGITFKEPNYIVTGDGYIRIIHIYQLPKFLDDFWLDHVFGIDEAIVSLDIDTKDTAEVKKNINKSIQEENARLRTAKNFSEVYDADTRRQELQMMYDELSSMGEVMKSIDLRIFVKGRNLVELDERCESIIKRLESDSFMATTFLNEGKREWQSLFEPANIQQKKPFAMKMHPMLTEQIAIGDPYCYSELLDENGDYMGYTPVGGAVIFDEFHRSSARKHYNSLVVGDMGSGKSTYLKKRFKANASKGNFIRTFDVTGEFEGITKEFGGKIIKCNGENGILNPLEILKAGDDESTSYAWHLSKLNTFYKTLVPNADNVLDFNILIGDFYKYRELTPNTRADGIVTGLPARMYPTFSDFLEYINMRQTALQTREYSGSISEDMAIRDSRSLADIGKAIRNLVENYGKMFDGHTSIDNITDEKIVTFDISGIKNMGELFNAQMFNMVSLCWDNAIKNGMIMKEKWESRELDILDINCFLIIIDEAHTWVNTKMPMILDRITQYSREARKYFAGIVFASQSIRDFVPQGESTEELDKIRTLFELTQYKFMFRQDASTMNLLSTVFRNALSFSQIEQIPTLETAWTILSISGDRSIKFKVFLSKEYEAQLFAGGR